MWSKNKLHFFRVFATKGRDLIRVRHMKSYGGLLQSSFMFSLQLVVLFTRPSVGTLYGIPDGRCRQPFFFLDIGQFFSSSVWILVIGLISSLLNLLWDVTIYHIVSGFEMIYHNKKPLPWLNYHTVSDGEDSNFKRQLTLTPYYFVHFAFRSLAIATFFIYMKVSFENLNLIDLIFALIYQEWAILLMFFLVFFNMWLTRHTYKQPRNPSQQKHLPFCIVVGGNPSKPLLFSRASKTLR